MDRGGGSAPKLHPKMVVQQIEIFDNSYRDIHSTTPYCISYHIYVHFFQL